MGENQLKYLYFRFISRFWWGRTLLTLILPILVCLILGAWLYVLFYVNWLHALIVLGLIICACFVLFIGAVLWANINEALPHDTRKNKDE